MAARDLAGSSSGPPETSSGPPDRLLRDLEHIVLQHLRAEGYEEAAHSLERETGLYLDAEHVAGLVRRGAWDEAERYVGAFVGAAWQDPWSDMIFYTLRRLKNVEALDRRIASEEGELLLNDLKAAAPYDDEVAKLEAALRNFKQRKRLDTASAREAVAKQVKALIKTNPRFKDKLEFPSFQESRLSVLLNQSLNYQHSLCKKKKNPKFGTLFSDHSCDSEIIVCVEPEQIAKSDLKPKEITMPVGMTPSAACARRTTQFAGCMTNVTPSLQHGVVAKEAASLVQPPNTVASLKHPSIPGSYIDFAMKNFFGQPDKFASLLYLHDGMSLLALGSNAIHKLWRWKYHDIHRRKLWRLANEIVMKNDTSHGGNTEEVTACMALSENELLLSASGGKISVFDTTTFKIVSTFFEPPPAVTVIVFHPKERDILVLGMEDSTIQIYNLHVRQVTNKLEGHHKKITGLSFSQLKNVLVSSGADAQLCVWSIDDWEKKDSRYVIQQPNHYGDFLDGDTRVQFHNDCQHLLVVNERQLSIYDWKLKCSSLWSPGNELWSRISNAVYSCDGLLVYAGFYNGTIKIFQGDLNKVFCDFDFLRRVEGPLSSLVSYPMVMAAHPSEPNQIALGMSNGELIVAALDMQTWTMSWIQFLEQQVTSAGQPEKSEQQR